MLRVVAAVITLIAVWLLWCVWFVMYPNDVDQPRRADAIFVLGPYLDPRASQAIELAQRLGVEHVAYSVGDTPGQIDGGRCVDVPRGIQVTCFVPSPYTTRGEARELRKLAAARHWKSVIVLAPRAQISRAQMLIDRCYSGKVQMVRTPDTYGASDWAYEFVHQSGGVAKALVEPGC